MNSSRYQDVALTMKTLVWTWIITTLSPKYRQKIYKTSSHSVNKIEWNLKHSCLSVWPEVIKSNRFHVSLKKKLCISFKTSNFLSILHPNEVRTQNYKKFEVHFDIPTGQRSPTISVKYITVCSEVIVGTNHRLWGNRYFCLKCRVCHWWTFI